MARPAGAPAEPGADALPAELTETVLDGRSHTPVPDLALPADLAAPLLLGCILESTVGGALSSGRIVEVEAYLGPEDPASHAAVRAGRTKRNASMFGPPGIAYLYFVYGVHWCVNVVTGREGDPQAVLIRAMEPLEGVETMQRRRGHRTPLLSGPGRVASALGLDGELDGHPFHSSPLRILPGWRAPGEAVQVTRRVGISKGRDLPLRFLLNPASLSQGAS